MAKKELTPEEREKRREYYRQWCAKNKDKVREDARIRAQEWRDKNPERAKAIWKKHRDKRAQRWKENPESPDLVRTREYQFRWAVEQRVKLLELFGGKCVRCGFSDPRALQIDHVHGGGAEHRRRVAWSVMYREMAAEVGSGKYQLLCANCNCIKRYECNENGRAPRSRRRVPHPLCGDSPVDKDPA